MSAALRWLIAALLALLLSSAYLLDGPSELDAIQAVADDVQDAQATAMLEAKP